MIFIENLSIEFSKLSNFSLSWISLFLKSLYKESYVLEIVDTSSLDSEITLWRSLIFWSTRVSISSDFWSTSFDNEFILFVKDWIFSITCFSKFLTSSSDFIFDSKSKLLYFGTSLSTNSFTVEFNSYSLSL